jgi:alpha-beta hydrolase superfamily lysophospholipase
MATAGARSGLPSGERRIVKRRALLAVGAALLGTVIALWFGLATLVARRLVLETFYPPPDSSGAPSTWPPALADPGQACGAEFQNLTLKRRDGLHLAAWWVPADKHAAIILMHGAGGSRHAMLPFLVFLHAGGWPVMMVDEIDHGDSDDIGRGVGFGWREREDVLSAVAELRARGYTRIGALGVSQGAAAAILGQAQAGDALTAIVSDSAYVSVGALLRRLPSINSLNPAFAATILWESGFWLGRSPDRIDPAAAAAHLGNCALLVIQGDADWLAPESDGRAIYAAACGDKEIWIVPGAEHARALATAPAEYAQRVDAFFDRYLDATPAPGAAIR